MATLAPFWRTYYCLLQWVIEWINSHSCSPPLICSHCRMCRNMYVFYFLKINENSSRSIIMGFSAKYSLRVGNGFTLVTLAMCSITLNSTIEINSKIYSLYRPYCDCSVIFGIWDWSWSWRKELEVMWGAHTTSPPRPTLQGWKIIPIIYFCLVALPIYIYYHIILYIIIYIYYFTFMVLPNSYRLMCQRPGHIKAFFNIHLLSTRPFDLKSRYKYDEGESTNWRTHLDWTQVTWLKAERHHSTSPFYTPWLHSQDTPARSSNKKKLGIRREWRTRIDDDPEFEGGVSSLPALPRSL